MEKWKISDILPLRLFIASMDRFPNKNKYGLIFIDLRFEVACLYFGLACYPRKFLPVTASGFRQKYKNRLAHATQVEHIFF